MAENFGYSLKWFYKLDPEYLALLDQFLERLGELGIKVVIFLPPYYPDTYTEFSRTNGPYQIVALAEAQIRAMAAAHGIQVLGSYNPGKTPCTRMDFLDSMHPKTSCIDKIFGGLLPQPMK